MAAEDRTVWLYAVTDDIAALETGDLIGVGADAVRTLRAAGLAAIAGDVGAQEFGEAALRRNLEDLDWLEQTARAHHAVIEAVAKRCPVVPMRLATVYSSDASVTEMLRERAADFRQALSRIAGCSEWGVKVFAVPPGDQAMGPGPAPAEQDGPAAGPGAAYLRRRRAQLTAHKDARLEATASAQHIYEQLSRLVVSARLYPPHAPDLTGQPSPMVLNAAYLLSDQRADAFSAAVADLRDEHPSVRLTVTGPWPAYSFVAASEGGSTR
jgi:Gas vesicle synthesis protein GvpL/GvpF